MGTFSHMHGFKKLLSRAHSREAIGRGAPPKWGQKSRKRKTHDLGK